MTTKAFLKFGPHIVFHPAKNGSNECHKAFGEYVSNSATAPNITVPDDIHLSGISPALENTVIFWSIHSNYALNGTNSNQRRLGKYKFGKAIAKVESYDSNRRQSIEITGPDLSECHELNNLILAGQIAPLVPHDQPQVKGARQNIKECFHRLIEAIFLAFDQAKLKLS